LISEIIDGIKLDIEPFFSGTKTRWRFRWCCREWHDLNNYSNHHDFVFYDDEFLGTANYDCVLTRAIMKEYPALKDYVERFLALEAFS
jgi:hypothetical protein